MLIEFEPFFLLFGDYGYIFEYFLLDCGKNHNKFTIRILEINIIKKNIAAKTTKFRKNYLKLPVQNNDSLQKMC